MNNQMYEDSDYKPRQKEKKNRIHTLKHCTAGVTERHHEK